jgi:PAS domain S-box-containing protein
MHAAGLTDDAAADGATRRVMGTLLDTTDRKETDASAERLRLLARATHEVIWDWDAVTSRLVLSGAVEPLFRYPQGHIASDVDWWMEHIHPEDRERIASGLRAMLTGTTCEWADEYRFERGDGTYADVCDRGFVVRDADGRATRMVGAMQDLTDRKRAEALLEAHAREQAALADLGLWALTDTPLAALERATVNLVASMLDLELSEIWKLLGPTEPGTLWAHVMDQKCALRIDDVSLETRFSVDATIRDQGAVSGLAAVIPGRTRSRGVLYGFTRTSRVFSDNDVCFLQAVANVLGAALERKEGEESLRRREHEVKLVIEHVADVILRVGPDLRYLYANPAAGRIAGLPTEHMIGQSSRSLGRPDSLVGPWEAAVQRVLHTGAEEIIDLEYPAPDGACLLQLQLSPELGRDGQVNSVLAVGRDVTAQRRLDAERLRLYEELLTREKRLHELVERALLAQQGPVPVRPMAPAAHEHFTAREREILRLLARGLTNQQIAHQVHLSRGTVKNYVARMLPRLNAADRTQAAVRAIELGLIETGVS